MRLICVTGMHRSGTSLAARILNLLGVDLGPEEAMMGASEANPRGYWELAAISDLDDEIIEQLGGRWHRLPPFDPGWPAAPELSELRRRGRALLDELLGGAELAGFKDPRLSVMLPFWDALVGVERTVTVLRHPDAVAGSIDRRDGFAAEKSAGLWIDHVAGAFAHDPAVVPVTYDQLLAAPVVQAARIAGALGLPEPTGGTADAIEAFADPSLRRSAGYEPAEVGPELATARSLWELTREALEDPGGARALEELRRVLTHTWELRNGRRILERDLRETRDELGHAERDLRTALDERDKAREEREQLRSARDTAVQQRDSARRRVAQLEGDVRQLEGTARQLEATARRRAHELQHAERAVQRWQTEYERLADRKAVKMALGLAQAAKPVIQASRRLRGKPVNPGRSDREAGPAPAPAGDGGEPAAADRTAAHEPATVEEAAALSERLAETAPGSDREHGPLVSICVLNRDGEEHLQRLLPGLAGTTYRDFELVMVDNDSSDGSPDLVEDADIGAPVTVIRNDHNASFSDGNNQAVRAASGEYVLLLNNDIEPATAGWLGRMVDTLEDEGAAAVGARLIYPRRPDLDNAGDTVHPDLTLQHRGVHLAAAPDGVPHGRNLGAGEDPLAAAAAATTERPAVTAACMLVRRDALAEVGGLTSGYRYGTEDVDLCLKLRAAGGRIVYDGGAVLWHHEYGTQNERGREVKRRNRLHNRELFVDLWGPRLYRQVLADKIRGEHAWSLDPLEIAITVTKDDPAAGWGDYYTAHELGDALADLGFVVSYVERYDDRWYDLDPTVDVLVVLIDAFELPKVPRTVTSVAWVRNWTDRWIDRPWFEDYDLVLASSERSRELIQQRTAKAAHLFPLATNPERFAPDGEAGPSTTAVFAGNYWDKPRDIIDALAGLDDDADVRVHGSNWEDVPAVARFDHGPVDYDHLPAVYRGAAAVIDDTAEHTLPYRAVNSRVFDALAAATVVITDNPEGVAEVLPEPLPVWEDADSLAEQLRWVQQHPQEAGALAERLREHVLAEHTYARRAEQLRDVLLGWCESRRWTIAIGVPERGQMPQWGDTHFARDLQSELELAGHPARVLILPEWEAAHRSRDDVVLHLFGLSELRTREGQVSLLWNISHPELVDADLVDRYDRAFVAARPLAEELDAAAAVPVVYLPQATDPARFAPDPGGAPRHELLFVGNSRKVRRRIIDDITPTDHDLAIYGADWTSDLVDPRYVRADHVDNRDLPAYYAAADIVLNDHWDDMREHGFLSNRLYDALAAGAFVISDHVDGLDEQFDGAVVTYSDAEDLAAKVDHYLAHPDERREHAERGRAAVLARHTFAHRVEELLEQLAPVLAERPPRVVAAPGE